MSRKILFSPVGGTDPISMNNLYDGSMLHICRVYQPDVVYLYLSKEMLDFQDQDDRYRYCLRKLEERNGHPMEIHEFERPKLVDVQKFDYFYNDFRGILSEIESNVNDDDEILINISSGTPQMKSALLVLVTLGEFPCTALQVGTPVKRINEHNHEGYDVQAAWELDEDNGPNFKNRCSPEKVPALLQIKNEGIIQSLIKEYDYSGAVRVAESMPGKVTKQYLPLLRIAENREKLLYREAYQTAKQMRLPKEIFPVQSGDEIKYFEYLLNVEIKRRKGEYADFLRALTPLTADLMWRILKYECGTDLEKYTYKTQDKPQKIKWSSSKLYGTEVLKILQEEFGTFNYGNVNSSHMSPLIVKLAGKEEVRQIGVNLRKVDEIRNVPAHNIYSVTDEYIKNNIHLSGRQIIELFRKAMYYAGFRFKDDYWNAYDRMNDFIIEKMKRDIETSNE